VTLQYDDFGGQSAQTIEEKSRFASTQLGALLLVMLAVHYPADQVSSYNEETQKWRYVVARTTHTDFHC